MADIADFGDGVGRRERRVLLTGVAQLAGERAAANCARRDDDVGRHDALRNRLRVVASTNVRIACRARQAPFRSENVRTLVNQDQDR